MKPRFIWLLILYFCVFTDSANALKFEGKVALVTGSSSGIGRELAREASRRGMKLVLVDIDPVGSKTLASELKTENYVIEADLAERKDRARVLKEARKRFGRIDMLFNNAGYGYMASVSEFELPGAKRQFDVNYWAYVDLANGVYPEMKKRGEGVIVNVASIMGLIDGYDRTAMYSASKHAVVGWGRTVAPEFKRAGIVFKVVCPTGVKTNFLKNVKGKGGEAVRERIGDALDNFDKPETVAKDIFDGLTSKRLFLFPGSASDVMPEGLGDFYE